LNITCRTGDNLLTIRTFRSNDGSYSTSEHTDWIYKDQTINHDHGADTIKIAIYQGKYSAGDPIFFFGKGGDFPAADVVGDFSWDKNILLVNGTANRYPARSNPHWPDLNQYGAVNWTDVLSKYQGQTAATSNSAGAIDAAGQIGQILVSAVATGLDGANNPALGAAGGLVAFIGPILLDLFDSQAPPPAPPDITQISDAVKNVVQEQLAINDAQKAASVFHAAANFCIKWWNEAKALQPGHDFTGEDKNEIHSTFNEWLSDLQTFQTNLEYLKAHPEIARYVLPAFITGLAADLQMRRVYLMIRKVDGHAINLYNVTELKTRTLGASKALLNARQSFDDYCKAKILADLTTNTIDFDEGRQLKKLVVKSYTGQDNLDFVAKARGNLEVSAKRLADDELNFQRNRPLKYIWKPQWG
jgi:hypothetical protein